MKGTAILFPGQGAQEAGMGRALGSRAAREVFERADAVLGYSISALCRDGSAEELTRTEHAQAAIFVTSAAAVAEAEEAGTLDRSGIGAAAGLSLGEYTALWFAGAITFEDGVRLVRRRGVAMQAASEAVPSGMVSLIGADREVASRVADAARGDGVLVVANLNAPGQVVLSGDREACARVPEAAKSLGVRKALPLAVAGAFHSPLMEPARRDLERALEATAILAPRVPVYSNVTAAPVAEPSAVRSLLARQVVAPVLWEDSMRRMLADGFGPFVEPPPGKVLAGLMRRIAPEAEVRALSAPSS